MKNLIVSISFFFLLFGCLQNQNTKDKSLEQTFHFSSSHYIDYKNNNNSGDNPYIGIVEFSKDKIILTSYFVDDTIIDDCNILSVSKEQSTNEMIYKTDCGEVKAKILNDTIVEVTIITIDNMTTLYKTISNNTLFSITDKSNNKTSIPPPEKDWIRILLKDVGTIDMPPTMEILDKTDKYQETKKAICNDWSIPYSNPTLIFQQKGLNKIDKQAIKKYARVIFYTTISVQGDFFKLSDKLECSQKELDEINNDFKNETIQSFIKSPLHLIRWNGTEIIDINGMPAIKFSYVRQLKKEPFVEVSVYRFQNYDRFHSLIISYRINEREYWESTMEKVLNSFIITNIK